MSSRVVINKDAQVNVNQLLIIEEFSPHLILAVSKVTCNKTGSDLYRVVGRNDNGKRVYKFDCQVSRDFPMIVTKDNMFLAILGVDKNKVTFTNYTTDLLKNQFLQGVPPAQIECNDYSFLSKF